MSFIQKLNDTLNEFHILKHPYYQSWNMGALSQGSIQEYAKQYYPHVDAFPRYISAIHSLCTDIKERQHLLGNLIEEESGEENHPELWMRFAEGLGANREDIKNTELLPETQALLETFDTLCRSSYAEGLAALYAYERQTPEVAHVKIEGLKKHYGVSDDRSLAFFDVHEKADVWHSAVCAEMIERLHEEEKAKATEASIKSAKALWKFLDGIHRVYP